MLISALITGFVVVLLAGAGVVTWFKIRPGKLKPVYFQAKWQELQKLCGSKATWTEAVVEADNLLGEALKKLHVRGSGVAERLVKVQRKLSNNDGVWFGHKLRNKIDADPKLKLKESDVKQALMGIRQALKDIGALKK